MKPLTSTKLNPINAHLIRLGDKDGFLATENIKILNTNPTPIATPVKETNGMLDAKYRKPNSIR